MDCVTGTEPHPGTSSCSCISLRQIPACWVCIPALSPVHTFTKCVYVCLGGCQDNIVMLHMLQGEAAAAINWVLKDGAGRLGRFLFARWGRELDCELKQFRLAGDLLMEAGVCWRGLRRGGEERG